MNVYAVVCAPDGLVVPLLISVAPQVYAINFEAAKSMKVTCLSCGVEKDTEVKEVYPYPDDGLVDDPIRPVFYLDCQDGKDWRYVVVCHGCFHRLEPDMWISRYCWEKLIPITPFEKLPLVRSLQHFSPVEGWEEFSQSGALANAILLQLPEKDWSYLGGSSLAITTNKHQWESKLDDSRVWFRYEKPRMLEFVAQQGHASEAMEPVIAQFDLVQVVPTS